MNWTSQQEAAIRAVRAWIADKNGSSVFFLAGYAGTGKSSVALELSANAGRVVFGAFTGKAALVMRQKGCAGARTLHSLAYKATEGRDGRTEFTLNFEDSPLLDADLIIIDEASMIGPELGRDILSFGKRILVLGDTGQLPPIEGLGFFTSREPDFMLTEIHRQARDNPIIDLATRVREGNRLELGAYGTSLVIKREQVMQRMILGVDQIICGRNDTRRQKNARMRQVMGREGRFAEGERVISLRNDKTKGLLNGAIWTVSSIEFSDGDETHMTISPLDEGMGTADIEVKTHHAWLDGREKDLPWSVQKDFDPVDYGYVLSCHKAQGSQWPSVLIYDEGFVFKEDANRWRYTAISRASERVVIAI